MSNNLFLRNFADNTDGIHHATQKYVLEEIENRSVIDSAEKNKILVSTFGENVQREVEIDLHPHLKNALNNGPLFRFFLDGSRKAYKIADITYDKRPFPIIAGQSAVGCVERLNRHKFKSKLRRLRTILAVPGAAGTEDELKQLLNRLLEESTFKYGLNIDHVERYDHTPLKDGGSYENRAIMSIHQNMIDGEKEIVHELAQLNYLNESQYLLKDGSLEYSKNVKGKYADLYKIRASFKRVVGVSKTFNPESLSRGNSRQRRIATDIANLKKFHRTPAYQYQADFTDEQIYYAVWYVRIRERYHKNSSPFDGILKVEKILMGDDQNDNALESSEVDKISANLIIERNPTTFGKEARWHNHLYPVFVTENFVKSLFHSKDYFLNAI